MLIYSNIITLCVIKDRKDKKRLSGKMKYRFEIKVVENFVRFSLELSAIVGDIFTKLFHNCLQQLILETMVSPTFAINVFSSHIFFLNTIA